MKTDKFFIARDSEIYDEDYKYLKRGKLHLFYDTPIPQDGKFGTARMITEIDSYLYPGIEEGDCCEISMEGVKYLYKNFIEV